MPSVALEVAVESVTDARSAAAGGADRLELCAALDLGGLTPTLGTFQEIRAATTLPLVVMIRPRGGDFVYDASELAVMKRDIRHFLPLAPDGFVFGVLTGDAVVNLDACRDLIVAARGVPCVFHRAFDRTDDNRRTLEDLVTMGFARVLTSGRADDALAGAQNIAKVRHLARGRIGVLPCGRVRASNVSEILRLTNCVEVHGSFAVPVPESDRPGLRGYVRRSRTCRDAVVACRAILDAGVSPSPSPFRVGGP
jgi:copper homeostasis protein